MTSMIRRQTKVGSKGRCRRLGATGRLVLALSAILPLQLVSPARSQRGTPSGRPSIAPTRSAQSCWKLRGTFPRGSKIALHSGTTGAIFAARFRGARADGDGRAGDQGPIVWGCWCCSRPRSATWTAATATCRTARTGRG